MYAGVCVEVCIHVYVCVRVYTWVCNVSMCVGARISMCSHTGVCVLELESYSFDAPSKFMSFSS